MAKAQDKPYLNRIVSHTDPNTINYLIFSQNAGTPVKLSLDEPFIMEGMLLGLCIKGTAKIKVNFKEYILEPGHVAALLPGQIVRILDRSIDFLIESLYISFDFILNLPLPNHFDNALNIKGCPFLPVSEETMKNFLEYFAFIVKQYNRSEPAHRDMVMKGLLHSLITEFIHIYKSSEMDRKRVTTSRQEELTDNFLKLLMTHYKEERTVSFYAGELCITPKHLSKTVKDVTGRSIMDWIHIVLITSAKAQLRNTKKTVSEISEELKISNLSFFCRLFKEHTGLSPLEYRNA